LPTRRSSGLFVTLAVGIGASTAVLSFVTAVMSASSPAPDMHRLVALWAHNRTEAETKSLVSPGEFFEWSRRARSFELLAASRRASFNVSGAGTPVRATAQLVTPGYFDVFRWSPAQGRGFTHADSQAGAPRVIVLSHAYWQNRLAGRPDVLGHTLKLDGEPATIIGVLPHLPGEMGLYLPLSLEQQRDDRSTRSLFVFARLTPAATPESARREMEDIGAALAREFPATHRGWTVNTRPLQEEFIGPQARVVFGLLVGIVSAVLVIGCVNIANLLLARSVARRGEMAVRLALGAGGWRVTRQLLVECGLLAAIGAAASLAISRWTLRVLTTLGAVDSPWLAADGLNIRVLLLTGAVAVVATVIAGMAPALNAWRANLVDGLRGSARSNVSSGQRTTRALVAAQVALASRSWSWRGSRRER
jgi:predicted permease